VYWLQLVEAVALAQLLVWESIVFYFSVREYIQTHKVRTNSPNVKPID